jgi:hypothetical protein
MSKSDIFVISLKNDLREKDLTLFDAAGAAKISLRQFYRHIEGQTKQGVTPIDTVIELKREGVISPRTVDSYIESIRTRLNFKRKKKRPPFWKRSLKNA